MGDPVGRPRDIIDDIIAADELAAQKRERKERRIFRVALSAVAVLTIAVGLFAWVASRAIASEREGRAAAVRRIDKLNDEIEDLGDRLVVEARSNGERIGELTAQIDALSEQVRQLGGDPVVIIAGGKSEAPPPASTTTTTTTSTTAPPPSPPPDDGVCVGPLCIPIPFTPNGLGG